MASVRKSLGDSSDELSEGGSSTQSGGARRSVICYTERGIAFPAKLSLSSEESEEDSSVSDKNSHIQTPSRHQSSEFDENEEFVYRTRNSSTNEDDPDAVLLAELESIPQIACRYTEEDPEFAEELTSRIVPPPVVTQWAGSSRQQGGRGRGRGNSHFDDRNKRRFESDSNYNNQSGIPESRSRNNEYQRQNYGQQQQRYNQGNNSYPSGSHSNNSSYSSNRGR